MIFNMNGSSSAGGGSGAGLNFKILGGNTQPINPVENTIWVNTGMPIVKWAFAARNPFSTSDNGAVWVTTGLESKTTFNALKENVIEMYPLVAKQCINSKWTNVDALIYQNGKWNTWFVYLFNNGNQFTNLTGGWCSTHQDSSLWSTDGWYSAAPEYGGGASINTTNMTVNIHTNTNLRAGAAGVGTKGKVDLTSYKRIKANCHLSVRSSCTVRMAIHTSLITPQRTNTAYINIPSGSSTVELDISNISGSYHIIFGGVIDDSDALYGSDLTISSVILE